MSHSHNGYVHFYSGGVWNREAPSDEPFWILGNPPATGIWLMLAGVPERERVVIMDVRVLDDADPMDQFLYGLPLHHGFSRCYEVSALDGGLIGYCEPTAQNFELALQGMQRRKKAHREKVQKWQAERAERAECESAKLGEDGEQ